MNNQKKPLVIIAGATAVGKTDLSVSLAGRISGEIISADSMQVYRKLDIGTAKVSREEMNGIPHYLIDEIGPDEEFNIYRFKVMADKYIEDIHSRNKIPILVGGTGFYIQSVLLDIDFTEEGADKSYRKSLEALAAEEGPDRLYQLLNERDPDAAAQIHPHNIKRVIRALEFYRETGEKISVHNEEQRRKESPYNFAYFVLNRDRRVIYDRIEMRVDQMIRDGLVREVQDLLSSGISRQALSMQGLGYKEIAAYLYGESTLEEASDLLKKNTRHFAKRQITWFKREPEADWVNYEDFTDKDAMLDYMTGQLRQKGIL